MRSLQLADVFLASSMVPAYTAAAFAKRFARIALRAPPAGGQVLDQGCDSVHPADIRSPGITRSAHCAAWPATVCQACSVDPVLLLPVRMPIAPCCTLLYPSCI